METSAVISDDLLYRYYLARIWDSEKPILVWMMLNPSTADASIDDPTIRRCMSFARREGCGGIEVVNLFALRSPDPKTLYEADDDPVGPENIDWIKKVLRRNNRIVVAWGSHGDKFMYTNSVVFKLMESGAELLCLGKTKSGQPRHPLYVKSSQPFIPF